MRSTTCSLEYTTTYKRGQLSKFLDEYTRVTQKYIDVFWNNPNVTENKHIGHF
jgi:hypothetical protein